MLRFLSFFLLATGAAVSVSAAHPKYNVETFHPTHVDSGVDVIHLDEDPVYQARRDISTRHMTMTSKRLHEAYLGVQAEMHRTLAEGYIRRFHRLAPKAAADTGVASLSAAAAEVQHGSTKARVAAGSKMQHAASEERIRAGKAQHDADAEGKLAVRAGRLSAGLDAQGRTDENAVAAADAAAHGRTPYGAGLPSGRAGPGADKVHAEAVDTVAAGRDLAREQADAQEAHDDRTLERGYLEREQVADRSAASAKAMRESTLEDEESLKRRVEALQKKRAELRKELEEARINEHSEQATRESSERIVHESNIAVREALGRVHVAKADLKIATEAHEESAHLEARHRELANSYTREADEMDASADAHARAYSESQAKTVSESGKAHDHVREQHVLEAQADADRRRAGPLRIKAEVDAEAAKRDREQSALLSNAAAREQRTAARESAAAESMLREAESDNAGKDFKSARASTKRKRQLEAAKEAREMSAAFKHEAQKAEHNEKEAVRLASRAEKEQASADEAARAVANLEANIRADRRLAEKESDTYRDAKQDSHASRQDGQRDKATAHVESKQVSELRAMASSEASKADVAGTEAETNKQAMAKARDALEHAEEQLASARQRRDDALRGMGAAPATTQHGSDSTSAEVGTGIDANTDATQHDATGGDGDASTPAGAKSDPATAHAADVRDRLDRLETELRIAEARLAGDVDRSSALDAAEASAEAEARKDAAAASALRSDEAAREREISELHARSDTEKTRAKREGMGIDSGIDRAVDKESKGAGDRAEAVSIGAMGKEHERREEDRRWEAIESTKRAAKNQVESMGKYDAARESMRGEAGSRKKSLASTADAARERVTLARLLERAREHARLAHKFERMRLAVRMLPLHAHAAANGHDLKGAKGIKGASKHKLSKVEYVRDETPAKQASASLEDEDYE